MRFFFTTYFLFIIPIFLIAQDSKVEFHSPLDIPLTLNGNFGELRLNHFHAGIDLKTKGKTGLSVFAIEDGFVSRISVSPWGYGNALYIEHPSGYTSVYGHLESFAPEIAKWVKEQQYKQESFRVNLFPEKNQFAIKKGEEIAKSGNTGSSGGPHLHLEIRKTASEHPINPLFFNFDIKDETKPVVENLYVYPIGKNSQVQNKTTSQSYKLVYYDGCYHIKGISNLSLYGEVGFGLDAIDYIDGSWSKCGLYQLELWVDDNIIYSFQLDELSYDKMRYSNSHIDYARYKLEHKKIHKAYLEPGNQFDIYKQIKNNGIYNFNDTKRHKIQLIMYDVYMNSNKIEFYATSTTSITHKQLPNTTLFKYDEENSLITDSFRIIIPQNALYSDIQFDLKEKKKEENTFSPLYKVHNNQTPLHIACAISIKTDSLPQRLQSKALIGLQNERNGKFSSLGGNYENGWVKTSTRSLGKMCVLIDTIAPSIQPLSIKKNKTLVEAHQIRFKIKDNLSGIKKYIGKIDNKWILFEYDAKNNLLVYLFDNHIKKGKNHQLELLVSDNTGNSEKYNASFFY